MIKAIAFYMDNISHAVIDAQKRVFDHFGMELDQIKTTLTHGEAIDHYLNNNEWDEIAIFDIDCIPLKRNVLRLASSFLNDKIYGVGIYGAAQRANHLSEKIYVSPAFCCFTKETWEKSGRASFVDQGEFDVGGFFTWQYFKNTHGTIEILWPSHVEVPKWDLRPGEKFGLGTTYDNQVYHAFLSRQGHDSAIRFINKCEEVING